VKIRIVDLMLVFLMVSFACNFTTGQTTDWPTEEVSSQVQDELKLIVKNSLNSAQLGSGVAQDATCSILKATDLEVIREEADAQIYRLSKKDQQALASENLSTGLSELLRPLGDAAADGDEQTAAKFRVKISRIKLAEDSVTARALLFAHGQTQSGATQINAMLDTQWRLIQSVPVLENISIVQYERAQLASKQKWFQDATATLFEGDEVFEKQLTAGVGDWINRIERYAGSSIYTRHGHALADVNGDGLVDLYLCQPGGLPNRLFMQTPNGRLVDHSAKSQIDWLNDTRSALFVDLDNDGDQDLVLGTFVGAFVCQNDGNGVFEKARKLPAIERDISSITAVDYDNDGDLDIHACVYFSDAAMAGLDPNSVNVYDSRASGGTNLLFRNLLEQSGANSTGELKFEDVTKEVGLVEGNNRFSLSASWEDFDNDGDQDLYVANDFGINCLHRNEGGKFVNVSKELGVED